MATETERKWLLANDTWRDQVNPELDRHIIQGYLSLDPERTVRVRISRSRDGGNLDSRITVKGKAFGPDSISRTEVETTIPYQVALDLLPFCVATITKVRHVLPVSTEGTGSTSIGTAVFEIDEFTDRHQGLVVCELELDTPRSPHPEPSWLGEEVSHDHRYYNSALAVAATPPIPSRRPYSITP